MKRKRPPSRPRKRRQRSGDYRIFVGAFPTGELAEHIQAVREAYDPKTARITAPHVTLAGTYWRTGPATAENEADLTGRLQANASKIKPFELVLGGIRTFGNRVVYLGVARTPELLAARQALLHLAGRDKHRLYTPHLTLAMRLDRADTQAMVADLKQGKWENGRYPIPINELCLMQRGRNDPAWRTITRLPL